MTVGLPSRLVSCYQQLTLREGYRSSDGKCPPNPSLLPSSVALHRPSSVFKLAGRWQIQSPYELSILRFVAVVN